MTDASDLSLAAQFARLVFDVSAQPSALQEHRAAIRALLKAMPRDGLGFSLSSGDALTVNGAPVAESTDDEAEVLRALASRLSAYGLEQFSLGAKSADADLLDLARALATAPTQADPLAFFAARVAAVDARGIPRQLRARPSDTSPAMPAAPATTVAGIASAPVVAAAQATGAAEGPIGDLETPLEDSVDEEEIRESPSAADPRSERLKEALSIPTASNPTIAAALEQLHTAQEVADLAAPLGALIEAADLAFRTGRWHNLLDAVSGIVAIEYLQLERDPSDERRREFGQALRKLASPLVLRQFAILRHQLADAPELKVRVQAVLYRFGTDGAEALIDEWASAPDGTARVHCLVGLRGLRRTHDALFELVRETDHAMVRVAARLLGHLGDVRAEGMLLELQRHPDRAVRRDVVAALEHYKSPTSLDALGVALLDESVLVRARAVHALATRGESALPNLLPLLDSEADAEVLASAVMALARIGTPDCVQALVRVATGESAHARKRSSEYRLQACRALVVIRTPQAMAAVQALRDDRDKDVRAGALRLVAQAARRTTTSMRAVSAP
ncbi:MAG: HEAT repeat domain-containing protein [Gemmatimonadaceae bacterium]|nr:HEAT repeat domain-containing protein [Gemmatimonadaceae bacterium]